VRLDYDGRVIPAFIPVERPRIFVALDGTFAAIQEPTRITIVTVPACAPFGVIETSSEAQVAWLGGQLLVLAGQRARLVDPRAAKLVAERTLDEPLQLAAYGDTHVLASSATSTVVLDAELRVRTVRMRERIGTAGPVHATLVAAVDDALFEIDPVAAISKRTWRIPGTVTAVGGNAHSLWRTTVEVPARITVMPLIALGQPTQHQLPEPLVAAAGHPRSDLVAGIGASGAIHVIDLTGKAAPRTLFTDPVEHPDAIAFVGGTETFVLVAQAQRPTQCVPLAAPTWRNELVAWTRSGVVESYPVVPAIAELAKQLELEEELVPAITLCYGAHLCGAPGVPPDPLADVLGGRWPDEVSGAGFLADTGLLVFTDDWITLAPTYCRQLDDL
jgi:hypothetical protein